MTDISHTHALAVIIFGIGNGTELNQFISTAAKHNRFFVLDRYKEYKSPRPDICVQSVVNPDAEAYEVALMHVAWEICIGKFLLFINRDAMQSTDDLKWYEEKYIMLDRFMVRHNMNINTIIGNYRYIQNNVMDNIVAVAKAPGIESLFNKFIGYPAIVCAAGPSLNKQLPVLKTVKDRACIFAVDTAAAPLQAAGIEPDVIVVIDYSEINERKFKGLKDGKHFFMVAPTIRPASMDLCKDKCFIVYQSEQLNLIIDQAFGNKGYIPGGGTVTHYAMQGAAFMGFDPVIFIGFDLAFTGGRTHAQGTMYDNNEYHKLFNNATFKTIKDQYGNDIETTLDLYAYIHETEGLLRHFATKFINSTEGGANIVGMDNIPFADAVLNLKQTTDYTALLAGYYNAPTIDKDAALGVFRGIREDLDSVSREASRGADIALVLLDMAYDLGDFDVPGKEFWARHGELDAALNNIMAKVSTHRLLECLFMKDVYLYHSTYNQSRGFGNRRRHILYSVYKAKVLFTKVMECANTFRNKFDEVIEKLNKEL